MKINVDLEPVIIVQMVKLLKEYKDILPWSYKDLKNIPPAIVGTKIS
jgi:hypothetical protein